MKKRNAFRDILEKIEKLPDLHSLAHEAYVTELFKRLTPSSVFSISSFLSFLRLAESSSDIDSLALETQIKEEIDFPYRIPNKNDSYIYCNDCSRPIDSGSTQLVHPKRDLVLTLSYQELHTMGYHPRTMDKNKIKSIEKFFKDQNSLS